MAIAPTMDNDELVIEVEFTASSGTYTKVCGLTEYNISRANAMQAVNIPDCGDESLPFTPRNFVTAQTTGLTGTGVWSVTNHAAMEDWFRTGATKNVRITNAYVTASGSTGDPEVETIPMKLESLNWSKPEKGVITAEISLVQDGVITVTDKA